jgi:hypothetical protein
MHNYGIDPDRYKRDIHEILYDTYAGLASLEKYKVYGSLKDSLAGVFRRVVYKYQEVSHRQLYKKYSLLAAKAYTNYHKDNRSPEGELLTGEQGLDAQLQYYNAFESYPERALGYLRLAREFEVPLIPQALPSYDAEEGYLVQNPELLRRAIPQFDPLWERDMIADTYIKLSRQLKKPDQKVERQEAAERAYALNQGSLRQSGLNLPAAIIIDTQASVYPNKAERTLQNTLRKIGFENPAPGLDPRFQLSITLSEGVAQCELYDNGRGIRVFRRSIPLPGLSAADTANFAEALGDEAFIQK